MISWAPLIFSDLLIANEQDYFILKEVTEAAMIDAIDYKAYREGLGYDGVTHDTNPDLIKMETDGLPTVRIREEKFVESFLMRFSKAAGMKKIYTVTIHDIDECPPKVSVTVTARDKFSFLQFFKINYDSDSLVVNKITGILEDPIPKIES